jgi:hypothetical protein
MANLRELLPQPVEAHARGAAAFYAYRTFMLGSIRFAATRLRTRTSSSAPSAAWSTGWAAR